MTEGQKKALAAIIRAALLIAAAPLIRGHLVTVDVLGVALDDLVQQIIGWLVAGGTIVWSLLEKWYTQRKIAVALQMPASTTEKELDLATRSTTPGGVKIP